LRLPPGVTIAHMHVIGACFLKDENEIASFRLDGFTSGMKVQANPDLSIDIALDEVPPPIADNDTLGMRVTAMIKTVRTILWFFVRVGVATRTIFARAHS
jgi:hypothetical protein